MKKRAKSNIPSASVAAQQDVVGLITTLVQKLTSFEAKIDMVLSRITAWDLEVPRQHEPTPAPVPQQQRRDPRPMHKAICADCGRECEVPFKPSAGRPVYCKECFSRRKAGNSFRERPDVKHREAAPVHAEKVERAEKTKPVKKKKPTPKRRKARASK